VKTKIRWDAARQCLYDANTGNEVKTPKKLKTGVPQICSDIPGYVSMGRVETDENGRPKQVWVDGRYARREDLKRSGCRELDPSEYRAMEEHTNRFRTEQAELAKERTYYERLG
jgi:hypothetical protein